MRFEIHLSLLFVVAVAHCLTPTVSTSSTTNITSNPFQRESACGLAERKSCGCMTLALASSGERQRPMTRLECSTRCASEKSCVGYSLEAGTSCYLHTECTFTTAVTCERPDNTFTFYRRHKRSECYNGGIWNNDLDACDCSGGWIGIFCDRLAQTCKDFRDTTYPSPAYVMLHPPGFQWPFPARCIWGAGGYQIPVATFINTLNFSRTFNEYRSGFYSEGGFCEGREYWIGLDKLHYYTNLAGESPELRVMLAPQGSNKFYVQAYDNVTVGDESTGFQITFGSMQEVNPEVVSDYRVGDLLSCLKSGSRFSSYDSADQTDAEHHCGRKSRAGWWFSTCLCNPFGTFYTSTDETKRTDHIRFTGVDMQSFANKLASVIMFLKFMG